MNIRIKLPLIGISSWIVFFLSYLVLQRFATIHYIELIVAFAILILVPIIIRDYNRQDIFYKIALALHVPFGIITVSCFYVEQGFWSAMLSIPWILITAFLALSGLFHIMKEKQFQLPFPLLLNVSHLFIVVGSGWLFLHRTGLDILHFSDKIVLLTAIHFHYAAFIAPYIFMKTGLVVTKETNRFNKLYSLLALGIMMGIPILAMGITYNQIIEFFGMLMIVLTLCYFAIFQLLKGNKYIINKKAVNFISLSTICIIAGMIFSLIYGFGHLSPNNQTYIISVETMVITHGILNSIGFGLFGVLGSVHLQK